jgi:hypothetical protein
MKDVAYGYAVTIPEVAPTGEVVTVQRGERRGNHVMHAETPDQSELYFEVTAYPQHVDHTELIAQQHTFLLMYAKNPLISATAATVLDGRSATTFDFDGVLQGKLKRRRFVFVNGATRTYRVVYDYTSPLNELVLSSLTLTLPD